MDDSLFLKGLFDGMRCGILCIDRDGRIVALNDLGARILDLAPAPAPGDAMDVVLAGQPRLVRLLRESLSAGYLPNREEVPIDRVDQPPKTVGYTLSRIGPHADRPDGVAMFFKDLTLIEHKAERERLRDRLAALGQMAASMAHEIRNPLASIEVTCALLRRRLGSDDAEIRTLVDRITSEVRRLNGTIRSSLEFVRPVAIESAETEVLPLLEQAIQAARDRRASPGVTVVTAVAPGLPAVDMDAARVRQVFENLILNAIEAAGEVGAVRVEAGLVEQCDPDAEGGALPHPWLQVRVADDGPGIPSGDVDKIFNPFFTTKEQGSGVGLATAKKIVDSHNGLIDVENGKDGGAVFTVRLPLHRQHAEAGDR